MSIDLSKLVNVKPNSQGWDCQCPICAQEGRGLRAKNQLRIFRSGAFHCVLNPDDRDHNRRLRALLRGYLADGEREEVVYIEPRLDIQQTYPESTLSKLLPQYDYWIGRGASPEVVAMLGGGLASNEEKGKLSGRFVFPCRDEGGQLIGFAGRLVQESSFAPKWKILGTKKRFIFPTVSLSQQAIETRSQVILVEGIGCVIALAGAGVWNTMCLFGLDISSSQVSYLISLGVKSVVVATNNEASGVGNRASDKLLRRLSVFFSTVIVHLPLEKDFMEMSEEQLTKWKERCMQ